MERLISVVSFAAAHAEVGVDSLRLLVTSQQIRRTTQIRLTGNRSYTLIVTSVFCKFADAREDVLLRVRLCFGGAIAFVVAWC